MNGSSRRLKLQQVAESVFEEQIIGFGDPGQNLLVDLSHLVCAIRMEPLQTRDIPRFPRARDPEVRQRPWRDARLLPLDVCSWYFVSDRAVPALPDTEPPHRDLRKRERACRRSRVAVHEKMCAKLPQRSETTSLARLPGISGFKL